MHGQPRGLHLTPKLPTGNSPLQGAPIEPLFLFPEQSLRVDLG